MNKIRSTHLFLWFVVLVCLLFVLTGCPAITGGPSPWTLNIQTWTPEQKADFFMTTWLNEKHAFDSQNLIKNKPADLISVLKAKREILENSRKPIRLYANLVKNGGAPDKASEDEIISFIRQLQTNYLYSGK